MCGIIGYTGYKNAKDILIESLKKLEYRGYDSAGIGIIDKDLSVFKEVGEITKLEKEIPSYDGNTGIGHTRWATHGMVNQENAHPQICCNESIALVHNGIIENFKKLKEELELKGHEFRSQTDTEVIVHLIEEEYQGNLENAVFNSLKKIQGSYAIVVISKNEPEKIVGARKESPLLVGVGDNENFIASDIPAILKYTNRIIYLDDGEICVINKESVKIMDDNNNVILKKEDLINWNLKDAEKSGFSHFMLKEIFDQPDAINSVLRGRVSEIERTINFHERVEKLIDNGIESIQIVACGTSYYAGMVGKYIIEEITGIPVSIDMASEYRYFGKKNNSSLFIAVTQSGETADTIAALREARNLGCKSIVVTNIIGSTATRISDAYILTQSGPEICVAATKTFTSQILVLSLMALKIAIKQSKINVNELYEYILKLKDIPSMIREILDKTDEIFDIAKRIKDSESIFFIGRGIGYPISLEGALKLKEISYIHAEGFAAGELKHGPFALLTKNTPVIAIANNGITYDKMIANIGEIKARGPQVIALADKNDTEIEKHVDVVIRFRSDSSFSFCIPVVVALQLLAYYVANLRDLPIDKPRNLAKSVTVE